MKYQFAKPIFLVVITIFFSFLMIMSPEANLDTPIFSPNTGVRLAVIDSELTAASFFIEKSESKILSDSDYITMISNYYILNSTKIFQLDDYLLNRQFNFSERSIIIRNTIIDKPLRLFGQPFKLDYNPKVILENQDFSDIYEGKSISCFFKGSKD